MAKIFSVYNRLQAGDYENGNGGKRRVSRLTQFIHATLLLFAHAKLGGSVAKWLGRWTCEQQVAGSNPGLPAVECNPGQVVNTYVTHQAV